MSVLIKGMAMPTGNDELRLIIRSNGQVIISHKTHYEEAEAVPVTPHGRLIDADALEALFWDGQCYFTENIKYKIKNIETICPAEEGET